MLGSAIRESWNQKNILTYLSHHRELDLINHKALNEFFELKNPEYVFSLAYIQELLLRPLKKNLSLSNPSKKPTKLCNRKNHRNQAL
jgi:hypothetical protein